ncbi:hypothetical protein [Variovorax paradoxus]|uniref:hypothetical protein n=1 Tax=Variovorax paradoxus TaxID=34073 RepID=UPI0029C99CD5|nr:hypothetical protein RZE77_10485 [Variovorax paradoxus]
MLVYGDATRRESVARKLLRLRAALSAARASPPGIGRHGLLVDALIEAGELAQGMADARFEAAGRRDAPSPEADTAMALAMAMARLCARSWNTAFGCTPEPHEALLAASEQLLPAIDIDVKQPEGYAFYALYPESYLVAAQRLQCRPWRVIGLRSIGTSLAAIAAVALGDADPLTLRPVGHPFDRRVAWAGPSLARPGAHHAIVDEGPGLSGSSMAGVVRQLMSEGVAPDRIHLFPGHGNGPGPQASAETRELWTQAASHVAGFDELLLRAADPAHRLQSWVEAIVGPLYEPLEEITGGGWRNVHGGAPGELPPAHPWQERRKFLARSGSGTWLVKFIGLGHEARLRFGCAQALAEAGFCAGVAGLCHGFMVERWHAGMAPLSAARLGDGALRMRLVAHLADYIAFRARTFPAADGTGASLQALCDMGRHNSIEAFGSDGAHAWNRHRSRADALQQRVRRIRTDNRMHAWEWLASDERILKTDAVDHHAGHDLVGCQDAAWDVAGAAAELGLSAGELGLLLEGLSRQGCRIDAELLGFYTPAYLAFQLGHFRMAAADAPSPAEKMRLQAHAERYAQALRRHLAEQG